MKINQIIKDLNGSIIPDEFNAEAFDAFLDMAGIAKDSDMAQEVIGNGYDFDKSVLFGNYMGSVNKWRRLIWCYQNAAYRSLLKGLVLKTLPMPTSWSMGLFHSPRRTALPIYNISHGVILDSRIDKSEWLSTKWEDGSEYIVRSVISPDRSRWQEMANVTLGAALSRWDMLRFDPNEMGETEGGYLSFIYTIRFGRIKFVFHTTERGFDLFSALRIEMYGFMPDSARQFLGQYAEMYC